MNGQAAAFGSGRNARKGSAATAPPAEINAASSDLSVPALMMAFHVAWRRAPKRTRRMTSRGKIANRSGEAGEHQRYELRHAENQCARIILQPDAMIITGNGAAGEQIAS